MVCFSPALLVLFCHPSLPFRPTPLHFDLHLFAVFAFCLCFAFNNACATLLPFSVMLMLPQHVCCWVQDYDAIQLLESESASWSSMQTLQTLCPEFLSLYSELLIHPELLLLILHSKYFISFCLNDLFIYFLYESYTLSSINLPHCKSHHWSTGVQTRAIIKPTLHIY